MASPRNLVCGYPRLAGQQAQENQLAIYRSFSALNTRLILYLQAELHKLEQELQDTEASDSQAEGDIKPFISIDWGTLELSGLHRDLGDETIHKQFDLIERIKALLPRYYEALRNQQDIADMEEPTRANLTNLQNFLASKSMGPSGNILCGVDATIWGSHQNPYARSDDLIAVVKAEKQDTFSRWCMTKALDIFWVCGGKRLKKADKTTGEIFWYETQILRLTYYFTTALVSLLLVSSITALWVVKSMTSRLALIASFNIIFSMCLAIFTTAPRSQVFAITAGFAAVQVVFIGSNDPSGVNSAPNFRNVTTPLAS